MTIGRDQLAINHDSPSSAPLEYYCIDYNFLGGDDGLGNHPLGHENLPVYTVVQNLVHTVVRNFVGTVVQGFFQNRTRRYVCQECWCGSGRPGQVDRIPECKIAHCLLENLRSSIAVRTAMTPPHVRLDIQRKVLDKAEQVDDRTIAADRLSVGELVVDEAD